MSRQGIESAFDGALDGEPIVVQQSWQAWSISHRDYIAGRTDLKAREVHFATYPNFAPTRAELETRARQCGFKYAMLQHYAGAVGDRQKLISEDTELFDFAASVAEVKPEIAPIVERENPAQTINATADAIRQAKDLLRELTPEQSTQAAATREDIAKLIEEAISKNQPALVREKTDLDRMRELMEFQRELQAQTAQNAPVAKSEMSDKERIELAMVKELRVVPEMFKAMRDALGTAESIDDPPSLASQIIGFVRDGVVPYVMPLLAPSVASKLAAMIAQVDDNALAQTVAQQTQPAQSAAMPQSAPSPVVPSAVPASSNSALEQSSDPLDQFVLGIKTDIIENADPDEAIGDACRIYLEQPQYQSIITISRASCGLSL